MRFSGTLTYKTLEKPIIFDTAKYTTFIPFHRHLRASRHQISTRPPETAPLPNGTAGRGLIALVAESDTNAFSCFILFRCIFRHFVPLFWVVVFDCCSCPISQIDFKVLITLCYWVDRGRTFLDRVNTFPQTFSSRTALSQAFTLA